MYERAHWNDDGKLCSKEEQAEQTAICLEKKNSGATSYMKMMNFNLPTYSEKNKTNSTVTVKTSDINSTREI